MEIDSKLPNVGTTIFTVMSQLAAECKAINLSQGFPSFEPPAELLGRISHHLNNGANQYAPMPGVPSLRDAIAAKTERLQDRRLDVETEITISTGATEGLFSTIQAVVRPGRMRKPSSAGRRSVGQKKAIEEQRTLVFADQFGFYLLPLVLRPNIVDK